MLTPCAQIYILCLCELTLIKYHWYKVTFTAIVLGGLINKIQACFQPSPTIHVM